MATELPLYFEIPGITELKEIFYQDGETHLTIYKEVLDSMKEEDIIKEMSPDFWRDKCYIDSEGNLNPVPFSKIRGFENHGNYILIIVDWTMSPLAGKILPAYFDDPDNKAHLAKILIDDDQVRDEDLVQYTINIAEFFSMTKKEQYENLRELLKVSCYLKEIDLPNGGSHTVRLPMPFVRIRGLRPIASEDGGYVFVDVDWQDRVNTDYRGIENQRIAMELPLEHDLDFPPEDKARNDQILRDAGLLGGKSKNKKSYKSKKSYKFKKSYKKSNKTKSKKKNKRRGF
jgi:hypothetical protein